MSNKNIISTDSAITLQEEDLLNYYPYAQKIKEIIQGHANNTAPLTLGIYGKWGTGKTSLLNLIENQIEIFSKKKGDKPYIKFHYNPWLYQTKEEILFDFFEILSRKLLLNDNEILKKVGILIKKYGRYLKSIKLSASIGINSTKVGLSFKPYDILKALGKDLKREEKSLEEIKQEISDTLESSNKKIIIFIDDVDRLDKDEIYTLFKLIKINTDFKNLIFLICFDPEYVSKAIYNRYGNNPESGKEFLGKIINIPLELPLIEKSDLDYFVKEKVKVAVANKLIEQKNLDELYNSLDGSYFSSPREIIRIVNSFSVSLFAIGDEVNIHDLFWIEYLKVKYFEVYQMIKNYAQNFKSQLFFQSIITFNTPSIEDSNNESGVRRDIKDWKNGIAYDVVNFLFPMKRENVISPFKHPKPKAEDQLDKELRINHTSHFEKYFSFHTKGKISEVLFSKYKSKVYGKKYDQALESLKEILNNTQEGRVVYRILHEIDNEQEENYNNHIPFLINNLSLFKDGKNQSHVIEILQNIAKKLKEVNNPETNKELCISIAEIIDYNQLTWFLGAFQHQTKANYIEKLEKMIIRKIKESNNDPFYENRSTAKMIMGIWSRHNKEEFQNYILDSFKSEKNIYDFFLSFPHLWNGVINGIIKNEDYEHIKTLINVELILEKIKIVLPDSLITDFDKLEKESHEWDDKTTNSGFQNVKQFILWYNKDKRT